MKEFESHKLNFQKVPPPPDLTSWEKVDIKESGEELVLLNELLLDGIIVKSQYFLQGLKGSMKECYVRETAASLLVKASKLLPNGYKLVVWDAWRSIKLQELIFFIYKKRIQEISNISEEKSVRLIQKYISLPSLEKESPPPHSTGGAVDLSIVDNLDNYLFMGTAFDDFNKKSATYYYEQLLEENNKFSDEDRFILDNRRLLFYVMTSVGFTNYPEEWWHYDYGNQLWGKIKGEKAIYGAISL